MDATDLVDGLTDGSTDITGDSGDGSSNGLDLNSLMGSLLQNATTAYVANQNATAATAGYEAQAAALSNPAAALPQVSIFGQSSGTSWLIIGAGVLMFALILRR